MGHRKKKDEASKEPNPAAAERQRLKRLAFSNGILSEPPPKPLVVSILQTLCLSISAKTLSRNPNEGRSTSSHFQVTFPSATAAGSVILRIWETKNPVLYFDFPQGQMKLFGTILYPKNGYLTLQFSKDGKNAQCEDYFDNMIVFSDAWWIGREDENPEETRLDFPKELYEGQQTNYEFIGGAGAAPFVTQRAAKNKMQHAKKQPETPTENDMSESESILKDMKEVVPVHHSDRPAGKAYKFAEFSSGLDSPDISVHKKAVEAETAINHRNSLKKENPCALAVDIDHWNALRGTRLLQKNRKYASGSKSKKLFQSSLMTPSKEVSFGNRASLVQATISTLFKKVEEEAENDDDIEEFSIDSKETDGSNEDWVH